jgi:hypothetical protein
VTTHQELVETSLRSFRDFPQISACWLAVEVLLNDPIAIQQGEQLANPLILLQDHLESITRNLYGVPAAERGVPDQ